MKSAWLRMGRVVKIGVCLLVGGSCLAVLSTGCDSGRPGVVLYAAQDRVFAEPVLREFESVSGIGVRTLYDSEATKTVGLANRLISESGRPQADVWWSNEEMRTRQLVDRGVLEPGWKAFGERRRVWVARTRAPAEGAPIAPLSLALLTNGVWRRRVALAYPVFGSTTTHLLALRQRWGDESWRGWCRSMATNQPWIVDGNSAVVRLVARGDADLGLTDSDDVEFGRREGLPVMAIPMMPGEGLVLPNTVAQVAGGRHFEESFKLLAFLTGERVLQRMKETGALMEGTGRGWEGPPDGLTEVEWDRLLREFDVALEWLREVFIR